MNPTSLLRTRERDLRQFGPPERGVRHWTHVEVPTDIWFVVEGRVNPLEGEPYRKRFVVADFADALRLHRESGFDNAMLHAYVCSPALFERGVHFERVNRVFGLARSNGVLLQFISGLMLVSADGRVEAPCRLDVGTQIFP